jgi:hypothetical protein
VTNCFLRAERRLRALLLLLLLLLCKLPAPCLSAA